MKEEEIKKMNIYEKMSLITEEVEINENNEMEKLLKDFK